MTNMQDTSQPETKRMSAIFSPVWFMDQPRCATISKPTDNMSLYEKQITSLTDEKKSLLDLVENSQYEIGKLVLESVSSIYNTEDELQIKVGSLFIEHLTLAKSLKGEHVPALESVVGKMFMEINDMKQKLKKRELATTIKDAEKSASVVSAKRARVDPTRPDIQPRPNNLEGSE